MNVCSASNHTNNIKGALCNSGVNGGIAGEYLGMINCIRRQVDVQDIYSHNSFGTPIVTDVCVIFF